MLRGDCLHEMVDSCGFGSGVPPQLLGTCGGSIGGHYAGRTINLPCILRGKGENLRKRLRSGWQGGESSSENMEERQLILIVTGCH